MKGQRLRKGDSGVWWSLKRREGLYEVTLVPGKATSACFWAGPSSFDFSCPPQGFLYKCSERAAPAESSVPFRHSDAQAPICFCPSSLPGFLF